jgi:FixJ family two-component response regulator
MKISEFTVPELTRFREQCNFTEIERQCFDLKAKDCTNVELAMKLNVSESTVSITMRRVRSKITTVMNWRG